MLDPAALRARLADVRERIARAADRAGRDPATIRLVAISKTVDADSVRALADAGQRDFGENKVQEAALKRAEVADLDLRWHLVGHLQSNKARKAVHEFQVIHSTDSVSLLRTIDEAASRGGLTIDVYVQVDLAKEATKHGAPEEQLAEIFAAARPCRSARVRGLMLLPPAADNPNDARPWFRRLRAVQQQLLESGVDESMLHELSMGMSHDFEVAIEEGATLVRVGTAIFGTRLTK